MKVIDTKEWKEYSISDIFETQKRGNIIQVPTGANIPQEDLEEDGTTPRITVTGINNGIYGYFNYKGKKKNDYREYENFISVSFLKTVFYQPHKATLDMKVHCLKPKGYKLNKHSGLFLVTVIRKCLMDSTYGDQISSTSLPKMKIKLPATSSGSPNFEYMETYIQNLEARVSSSLTLLESAKKSRNLILDLSKWERFHLYDDGMFEIKSGNKLDKAKMSELNPTINFVGRANANNGITTCVDRIKGIEPYPAGSMTVSLGGEYLGSCFVQPKDFYTSQNVNVLIPKWAMPIRCKKFIAAMVFKEGRTYYKAFIDELNKHMRTDFSILLPVKNDGTPNWEYMETYIKGIETKVDNKSSLLIKVV